MAALMAGDQRTDVDADLIVNGSVSAVDQGLAAS
jgi:hypothetical protein